MFINKYIFLILLSLIILPSVGLSTEKDERLGVGTTNQLATDLPAISIKLQKSPSLAVGALFGFDTSENTGGWGAGLKFYRNFIDESQLTFYGSMLAALLNKKNVSSSGDSKTGFQLDLTMGTEFHFSGLESLGFSFEFGLSFEKINDFVVKTVGHSFLTAGVHFYF